MGLLEVLAEDEDEEGLAAPPNATPPLEAPVSPATPAPSSGPTRLQRILDDEDRGLHPRDVLESRPPNVSPSDVRRNKKNAAEVGLPEEAVGDAPEQVQRHIDIKDNLSKTEDSEKSRGILLDRFLGPGVEDDVDTMVALEKEFDQPAEGGLGAEDLIQELSKEFWNTYQRAKEGFGLLTQSLGIASNTGASTHALTGLEKLSPEAKAMLDKVPPLQRPALIEQIKIQGGLTNNSLANKIITDAREALNKNRANIAPGSTDDLIRNSVVGALDMFPALFVSFLARDPKPALAIITSRVFGQRFHQAVTAGRSIGEAFIEGIVFAGAEWASEKVPLGILTKEGGKFVVRLLKASGAEFFQEAFIEALDVGFEAGYLNKDMSWEEIATRIIRTGISGAGTGALLATPSHGLAKVSQTVSERGAAKRAEAFKEKLKRISDIAGQSPVAAENPQLFQDVVDRLKADTSLETVRVNAAGLEATMEAAGEEGGAVKFLVEAGVDEAEVNRAALLGQDVVVELPNFLKLVEEQKIREVVLANVRESDSASTLAEVEVQQVDFAERSRAAADEVLAELDNETDAAQLQADAREVAEDFERQAIEAKAFPKNARNVAAMVESVFITEVIERRKAGDPELDVKKLYESFGLKIVQERAAGQPALSQRVETVFQDIDNLIDLATKRAEREEGRGIEADMREEREVLKRVLADVTDILKTGTADDPFVRRGLEEIERIQKLIKRVLEKSPRFDVSMFAPQLETLRDVLNSGQPFPANDLDQLAQQLGVTPEQLAQELEAAGGDITKTPAFLAWFGDSKVVDESGAPMVVHHATIEDEFSAFFTDGPELGSHFGTPVQANALVGQSLGSQRVIPVYLSIQNPIRLRDEGSFTDADVLPQLVEQGIITFEIMESLLDTQDVDFLVNHLLEEGEPALSKKILQEAGFDGVVYLNRREGLNVPIEPRGTDAEVLAAFPNAADSYIAFEPTQIKSVFNRGTFDPTDPNTLNQRPTITPTGTHSDLTTPELVAGFVVQPTSDPNATNGVSRAEVMERLRNDPVAQQRSRAALDAITPDDTVPMYRFIISGRGDTEVDFEEGDVSLSLTPEALFRNVSFLGFGKLAPGETLELVRYDVPKDKVVGYLPALIPDIKRGVNKAIKNKGIGQQNIQGTLKVTDPAARAKELIIMQEEVLADVTGITSQRLGDIAGGSLSIDTPTGARTSFHQAVLSGLVQTAEDFLRLQPSNQRAIDSFEDAGIDINSETFIEDLKAAEIAVVEPAIDALTDFFGDSVRQEAVDAAQPAIAAALKGQPKFGAAPVADLQQGGQPVVDPLDSTTEWHAVVVQAENKDGVVGTMTAGEAIGIIQGREQAAEGLRNCVAAG